MSSPIRDARGVPETPTHRVGNRDSPARGSSVRRHNLTLVLGQIADGEPLSRAAVAAATGLTRGTVSSLVDELLAAGLVTELAAPRGTPGRPASPLQLNRAGPAGLGIEIGVDHVGACVVDLAGALRTLRTVASDHRDAPPSVAMAAAVDLAREVVVETGLRVAGVVVAVPGIVDPGGVLWRAPNLPRWTDVAADELFTPLLTGPPFQVGTSVGVGNEADLAALGERWAGDAPADMIYVSGDIGVGGAVIMDGELFGGGGGRAGEIGHVVVDPTGPSCRCGGRGCLERVAGLEALLHVAGAQDVDDLLRHPERPVAVAGHALAIALAGAVNLLDVPAVVLGGVYAQLGEPLRLAVAGQLRARVPWREAPQVRTAVLGPEAALRGAATSVVRGILRGTTLGP